MFFKPATRKRLKARVLFTGPAKGGKSMSGLRLAMALARFEASLAGRSDLRIACIDTENRSLSKYVGLEFDGMKINFDVAELAPGAYAPQTFIDLMRATYKTHDVIFIDSTSAEWQGSGGTIDIADKATARSRSKNSFTEGWRIAGPEHQKFVDEIISCPIHIIATARSKMGYETKSEGGKTAIIKLGLEPIQRDTTPFEFDLCVDMDGNRNAFISGRCPALKDKLIHEPGAADWKPFIEWLHDGESEDDPQAAPTTIAPEVVPPSVVVETSSGQVADVPPPNPKTEVIASIRAKRRDLQEPESKEADWAAAFKPGSKVLEDLDVGHLEAINTQLTDKVKATAKAKKDKAMEAAERSLKPSAAKIAQMLELFREYYGPDYDQSMAVSIKRRGDRQPDQWTEVEVDESISKLKTAIDTRDMEKALSAGK